MFEVRAKAKDGKEVVGWYFQTYDRHHFVMPKPEVWYSEDQKFAYIEESFFIEIDPTTAGVLTGKKDKHGREIAGSMGDLTGGDRVKVHSKDLLENCVFYVEYDPKMAAYKLQETAGVMSRLSCWNPGVLEIIEEGE